MVKLVNEDLSYYREDLDDQIIFLFEHWIGVDIFISAAIMFPHMILMILIESSIPAISLFVLLVLCGIKRPSKVFLKFLKECWYKEISDESLVFQKKTKFRHVWYYNYIYFDNFKEEKMKEVYAERNRKRKILEGYQ
jgi:hypothetical protein